MKLKFIIALLSVAFALSADELMLVDFEDASQLTRFSGLAENANSMTQCTDAKFIGSGKASGKLFFPKAGKGEHRWPRQAYRLPEGQRDWKAYDELRFTVFNPTDEPGRITLDLIDEDNISYDNYACKPVPGKSEFVWILPEAVRTKKINAIRFSLGDSPIDCTFYIDDIKLVVTAESVNAKLQEMKKRIGREAPEVFWKRAGLQADYNAILKKLSSLGKSGESAALRSSKFMNFMDEYCVAKKKLWQTLCAQNVKDFDNAFPEKMNDWGYAVVSGFQKVYRRDLPFFGAMGGELTVSLARRERESVQLVLRSRRPLEHVKVSVAEVKRPHLNDVVPEVTPLLVGHVKPPKPSYPVEAAEWRPDPLLPFTDDFPLGKNVWQAIWLDVHALPESLTGSFNTTVTVEADGMPALKIPLNIHVWKFELPAYPTQPSLVNFHSDSNIGSCIPKERRQKVVNEFIEFRRGQRSYDSICDEAKELRETEIAIESLLLEHNVTPAPLYITRRRLHAEDVSRWRAQGGRYFSLTYLPPQTAQRGKPFEPWVKGLVLNNIKNTLPQLEKEGLVDEPWCFAFDEINDEKFFAAKTLMQEIKAEYPQIKFITTANDYDFGKTNGLDKLVDAWCPQIERFVQQIDLIREVQKSGKKVWYYNCCYDPGLDMLVEKALTAPRLLCGLGQIKYCADGFLYYGVISGNAFQDAIDGGPLTKHTCNNRSTFNGCGVLVYPTTRGPASSLRLKAMRDGFEDVEYLHLLQKIDPMSLTADQRKLRDELLSVPENVLHELEDYDQTGDILDTYRKSVGSFLDSVHKAK